ncbi:MAG: DUF998 domain-containing protein [Gelidibacter sp.]
MKIKWIGMAAIAGVMACVMELILEVYAASKNPGYSPISQSISYLGNPESPTHHLVKIGSIFFTVLFVFFAVGFFKAFKYSFDKSKVATVLLVFYGLGQGMGAGLFSMDTSKSKDSWVNIGHDIFSGIGDVALVLFPLVMLSYFSKTQRYFTILVSGLGIAFMLLFLSAKFEWTSQTIPYKGLWQRLFQLVYYVNFIFIAYQMGFKSTSQMDSLSNTSNVKI